MLSGDFQHRLHKLNPKLKIFCGDDRNTPAGIYQVIGEEYVEICGADKNEVPEFTIYDETGHIIKSGWRRILNILIHKKLVNKDKAQKLFRCWYFDRNTKYSIESDEIAKKIKDAEYKGKWHRDDLADIGSKL